MSAERRPSKKSTRIGWFSMITVGAIVIAAGFAIGIVAGVTWEEPGLVISWLSGDADGIEWGVEQDEVAESDRMLDETADGVPDVAAPPPLGARLGDRVRGSDGNAPSAASGVAIPKAWPPEDDPSSSVPVAVPKAAIAPPAAAPKQAAAKSPPVAESAKKTESEKFSVQVGAFADRLGADELATSLRKAGYAVYLSDGERGARWRVRVGPHSTREAAEGTAKRLQTKQQLPTWVLSEDS